MKMSRSEQRVPSISLFPKLMGKKKKPQSFWQRHSYSSTVLKVPQFRIRYTLEIKQIVDYPRVRIYRELIQKLLADESLSRRGDCRLFSFMVLCSYANGEKEKAAVLLTAAFVFKHGIEGSPVQNTVTDQFGSWEHPKGKKAPVSKTTASRILARLDRLGYLNVLTFSGRHGTVIYLENYLSVTATAPA